MQFYREVKEGSKIKHLNYKDYNKYFFNLLI